MAPLTFAALLAVALARRALGQELSVSISAAPSEAVDRTTGLINATYFALCSSHLLCEAMPSATGDANCCPSGDGERRECCPDDFDFREQVCAQPFDFCTGEADGRRWTTCCADGHRCADTAFSSERMCVPEALQSVGDDCFPRCNHMYGSCEYCGVGAACCHSPHSDHRPECANTSQVIDGFAGGRIAVCVMQTGGVELHHREGMDCWQACGNQAGGCQWCGDGNACCRDGWAESGRDPPECRGTGNFTGQGGHECVRQVEPSAVQHMGVPCWSQCGRRGGSCDWCGVGNACCREGWAGFPRNTRWHRGVEYVTNGDPPECENAAGHEHPWRHECVQPSNVPDVLHRGQDCFSHCGTGNSASTRSGPCDDWCGLGNLCCRQGYGESGSDVPICAEAVGFSTPWQHECVGFPSPIATTPAPREAGTTLFEANQTQGGFLMLFSLSMSVPGTSIDIFELQGSATSMEAAIAHALHATTEQVQVLRVSIAGRRLQESPVYAPSAPPMNAVNIVAEVVVGCGNISGQVAMLVSVQSLHTAQGGADLSTSMMTGLGLPQIPRGLRLLGVELPTGAEADPGDVHIFYPENPWSPDESADDYTEDVGDPAMSEDANGGHLGNFTPAHPVVVDFQLQWPSSEANATRYTDPHVVQALQVALATALGLPTEQVRIGTIAWSDQLQSLIVESSVIVASDEQLHQLPYGIMGLADSFTFGPDLSNRTGLPPPSGVIARVEGSGAESIEDIPPDTEPGAVPGTLPSGIPTAIPAVGTVPLVADPGASPGAAPIATPGVSLGAPVAVTPAPAPPQAVAEPGSQPAPPSPPGRSIPSPAAAMPIFTDDDASQSRGDLDVDSSFFFDVPVDEASQYGNQEVVAMLEDAISHGVYTDSSGNQVPIRISFLGTSDMSQQRWSAMQRAAGNSVSSGNFRDTRLLTEGSATLVLNYTVHSTTVDQQQRALAGARQLGDPASPGTALFAERFSSQAEGAGLTPIEPTAMAPGVTVSAGPPPPPPPDQHTVPMAASASMGMFAVAACALVLALCFFVLMRGSKKGAKRGQVLSMGSESARDVLSGSDSDEMSQQSSTPLTSTRSVHVPSHREAVIPEWLMHAPRLPVLTSNGHGYATLPEPNGSLRTMTLESQSNRTF